MFGCTVRPLMFDPRTLLLAACYCSLARSQVKVTTRNRTPTRQHGERTVDTTIRRGCVLLETRVVTGSGSPPVVASCARVSGRQKRESWGGRHSPDDAEGGGRTQHIAHYRCIPRCIPLQPSSDPSTAAGAFARRCYCVLGFLLG